jgi:hypothetical protein
MRNVSNDTMRIADGRIPSSRIDATFDGFRALRGWEVELALMPERQRHARIDEILASVAESHGIALKVLKRSMDDMLAVVG